MLLHKRKLDYVIAEVISMGTMITLKVLGRKARTAINRAKHYLKQLEGELSRFIPNSKVSLLNRYAGEKGAFFSPNLLALIQKAIDISHASQGAFDITITPLMTLWNFKNANQPPIKGDITQTLKLVDYKDIIIDIEKQIIKLANKDQAVDLGGIAKGYAGDEIIKIFRLLGITSGFINLGGNVATLGLKEEDYWQVGVNHPRQNKILGIIRVKDKTVVTSGDYERYFIDQKGQRYHHILNPITGYPADSGLMSVSIVADEGVLADALATSIMILGEDKGLQLLRTFPHVEAVLIKDNLDVIVTEGLRPYFKIITATKVYYS